jgi:hypothetical protein
MNDLKRYALAGSLFFLSACGGGSCGEDRDKCSAEGQRPCNFNGPGESACDPGLTTEAGEGKCVADCGDVGERCCKSLGFGHECGETNHCNAATGKCVAGPPPAPCALGPHEYSFTCVAPDGCALEIVTGLGTLSEDTAKDCVKDAFKCVSVSKAEIEVFDYCYDTPFVENREGQADAVDAADALRCAKGAVGGGATVKKLGECDS